MIRLARRLLYLWRRFSKGAIARSFTFIVPILPGTRVTIFDNH